MTQYDCYKVMSPKGKFIRAFCKKKDAIAYIQELHEWTHNNMYIVDVKGTVVYELYSR